MRRSILCVGLLAGALYGWSLAQSTAADTGPYVTVDVGANIVPDIGLTIRDPFFGTASGDVEIDPGVRFGVAGGYQFNPMFSAELETGFIYNQFSSDDDVTLSHIPFLANAVLRFQNSSPLLPFIGAGAGGVASFFDLDNDNFDEDENDSDVVFAWQAFAGLHYKINDNMSAGITYKYLWIDSPEFEVFDVGFEFDTIHNHSILASFNWSF